MKKRNNKTLNHLLWLIFWLSLLLPISQINSQELSRLFLALYDSERGQTTTRNHIHLNAEVVLNHLGCIVDYWDIAKGLPDEKRMKKYNGVLTWFYSSRMREPGKYLAWAERQLAAGRKYVILGSIGAYGNLHNDIPLPIKQINKFVSNLGFVVDDRYWSDDPLKIELVSKVPEMVEFERSLDYELTNYEKYRVIDDESKVYLTLKRNDLPASESVMVLTGPAGGFAAAPYVLYQNQENDQQKWRLNPFRFFEEALALQGIPRPDVTTKNGMRLWMSHIDGDALISISQTRRGVYCGEVIRDEIIKPYRWPISVSVVVGEVEKRKRFIDIARSIYKIDWVEAASHSYSHPFYWADDSYDKADYPFRHLQIKGYEFNLKQEINGSVNFINKLLLPAGKRVRNFFWTGNCKPTTEAIKLCDAAGLTNVNGGDTVFDHKKNSYTNVAPLSAIVGDYRQVYAPNANENIYTDEWQGPYFGFKHVLQTFDNTETPRRIKPIDIYYHFYSGERWSALNALKTVMESTMKKEVAPVFMSEYLQIVAGFFSAKIEYLDSGWRLSDYGECRTIRFDHTSMYPDLERSKNVFGFWHYQNSLYVFLGEARTAEIRLTSELPDRVYFEQASHSVTALAVARRKISFSSSGYGKGQFVVNNLLPNRKYLIIADQNSATADYAQTDAAGRLRFSRAMAGGVALMIEAL